MSYFDDASLVMIPSGYKDQKVYSVKPIDGSGDLTFSRASNATRVNSSGLVEKVRTNLFAYSNEFDNAYWTKPQASVVSGQPDPNGGTAAFKLVEDTSTNFHWLLKSGPITGAGEYGLSIFAKPAGRNYIAVGNASLGEYAYFNLSNGTIVSSHPNAVGKIEAVGNGFYRCSVTLLTSSSAATGFFISTDGSTISYTGDGTSGLFIFGAQLENGVTTDYIATTTTAVSVGPVSGLPRLDYSGGASCPSLLLEPQRTNLVTFSEQINDASWNKNSCTISANSSTSPDGYLGADKFIPNNAASGANFQKVNFGASGSTAYSYSVFLKAAGFTSVEVGLIGRSPAYNGGAFAQVNLTTGAITSTYLDGTWTSATSKIEAFNNGWYQVSVSGVSPSGTTGLTPAVISLSTGNGTDGFFVWGAQVEAGAYKTSYIGPTYSSAVTRVADAASKTGISSLIGQTEGTLFYEFDIQNLSAQDNDPIIISAKDSGGTDNIYIQTRADGGVRGIYYAGGGVEGFTNSGAGYLSDGSHKIALGYKANDFVLYIDGVQVDADTSGATSGSFDEMYLGYYNTSFNPSINSKQALLFQTRLSNDDLATLTTL